MSDIILSNESNIIVLEDESNQINLTPSTSIIKLSNDGAKGDKGDTGDTGPQGPQGEAGEGVPVGGVSRQVLTKIDGTDYNTEWKSNWIDYASSVKYNGTDTSITDGLVKECTLGGDTLYRFINSIRDADGYPTEDSFYADFDGTNLTNLIVTR